MMPPSAEDTCSPGECERPPARSRPLPSRRELVAVSLFLLVALFFVSTFRMAVVRGESMLPTYHDGQILLVRRGPGQMPRRGDVVLLRRGRDVLVKRAIYLPGDVITGPEVMAFRRVWDYFEVTGLSRVALPFRRMSLRVPPGYVVVLGDNRAVSDDSRSFGPIAVGGILGRVVRAPALP